MDRAAIPHVNALAAALSAHGLNLVGVTAVEAYDARVPAAHALRRLWPAAQSAIVIGNGGAALWTAFREHCRRHPEWQGHPDPLDRYTQATIERVALPLLRGAENRVVYPFRFPEDPVAFVHLAECAGLGRRSLLGVLVHPVYGPWIALRAAVLTPERLWAPRPADGFDPCPTCTERACIAACPVGAVSDAGWDVPRCTGHRLGPEERCAPRCHARYDCVIGREHRYPPDALAYHQVQARATMAALAGRTGGA
jgi:epoxyqueuosine reductase QueG